MAEGDDATWDELKFSDDDEAECNGNDEEEGGYSSGPEQEIGDSVTVVEKDSLTVVEKDKENQYEFVPVDVVSDWKEESGDESSENEENDEKRKISIDEYVAAKSVSDAKYQNIMIELADGEAFLIDGDSLLTELINGETVNWKGGEFLQLVYLMEIYLKVFTERGGVFHVCFFKECTILYDDPSKLLAREILKLHLSENMGIKVLSQFESFHSEEWAQYIRETSPSFVLLSNGLNKPRKKFSTVYFNCLLISCQTLELSCVLMDDIQYTMGNIAAYFIESSPSNALKFITTQANDTKSIYDSVKELYVKGSDSMRSKMPKPYLDSEPWSALLSIFPEDGNKDICIRLCIYSVAYDMKREEVNDNFTEYKKKAIAFLVHCILLDELSLQSRSVRSKSDIGDDGKYFTELQKVMVDMLKFDSTPKLTNGHKMCNIMDLRLFSFVHSLAVVGPLQLSSPIIEQVQMLWQNMIQVYKTLGGTQANENLELGEKEIILETVKDAESDDSLRKDIECESVNLDEQGHPQCKLLIDFAGDILNTLPPGFISQKSDQGLKFSETYHWHSGKPLSDDYERTPENASLLGKLPVDPKERTRFLKGQQKYKKFMQFYGESIEGRVANQRPIIVEKTQGKKKKEKKESKKAADIKAANSKDKEDSRNKHEFDKWDGDKVYLDKLLRERNYEGCLDHLTKTCGKFTVTKVKLEVVFQRMKTYSLMWQDNCKSTKTADERNYTIPAKLMMDVQEILNSSVDELTVQQRSFLAEEIKDLGFEKLVDVFQGQDIDKVKKTHRKQSEKELSKTNRLQKNLNMSYTRFQLEHMSHLLRRDTRTDKDPRVEHFIPDTWQRLLLDAVDKNESALIVAPTSSGKTYASYYCMEKVLKESDDGIVVYVSPTKALVNQVAATVHARFSSKKMPPGKAVYGVFTRDYRTDALNSQILVTVPQCLEILLLSPKQQEWISRIRYVIFDEVHCLGSEIGAEVWEHLLLLIECPFLALSATIGNPKDLHSWLQSIQNSKKAIDKDLDGRKRKSYRVNLVTYSERYSDLEKYVFVPECGISKRGLTNLHPAALLNVKTIQRNGIPDDVSLMPKETLQFYEAMHGVMKDKQSLQKLDPDKYFQDKLIITKTEARVYEKLLLKEFHSWTADRDLAEKAEEVLASFSKPYDSIFEQTKQKLLIKDQAPYGMKYVEHYTEELIEVLHQKNMLPALIFSDDRRLCEYYPQKMTECFMEKEQDYRESHKTKIGELQKRVDILEKEKKKARDKKDKKSKSQDQTEALIGEEDTTYADTRSKLEKIPDGCTLVPVGCLTQEEYDQVLNRIWFEHPESKFCKGLRRGLSYHHAGLGNKYRQVVECLFRKKHLQVVAATGTLAMGIHMPCKTVVMGGDSVWLNALQYRQRVGRAGRRGYDLLGNVVFYGLKPKKVKRLITSGLGHLNGNWPITVGLVLRLLLLWSTATDQKMAHRMVISLLREPFFCNRKRDSLQHVKHHFLFSFKFLFEMGLINSEGHPLDMAGLATHLHFKEPGNWVFVDFIQEGLFHQLVEEDLNINKEKNEEREDGKEVFSEDLMEKLIIILSHIFSRLNLPYTKDVGRNCENGKVILPGLPKKFYNRLKVYNGKVWKVFHKYLTSLGQFIKKDLGEETKLPLSNIAFPSTLSQDEGMKCGLTRALEKSETGSVASSAFLGITDSDIKPSNFMKTIRKDIYTDMNVIPTLDTYQEGKEKNKTMQFNAFALDFYHHEILASLMTENGLMSGDVFDRLKDFLLAIKAISTSLTEMGPEADCVVLAFQQLATSYSDKFGKAFPRAQYSAK